MNHFIELCYNSITRKPSLPNAPSKRSSSPSPFGPTVLKMYDCGNFCCLQQSEDLKEWKRMSFNKRSYFFCCEDCCEDWLQSPSQLGSWSPPFTQEPIDPPSLSNFK